MGPNCEPLEVRGISARAFLATNGKYLCIESWDGVQEVGDKF